MLRSIPTADITAIQGQSASAPLVALTATTIPQGQIAFSAVELKELVAYTAKTAVEAAAKEQRVFATSIAAQLQAAFADGLEAQAVIIKALQQEVAALRVEIHSLKASTSQVPAPRKETWVDKVAGKGPAQGNNRVVPGSNPVQSGSEWTQVKSKKRANVGTLVNPLLVDDDQMEDFPVAKPKPKVKPKATKKIGSTRDVVTLPDVEVSQEPVPSSAPPLPEDAAHLLPGEFKPRPPRQFFPKAVKLECVPHHTQMTYKDWRSKVAAAPGVSPGNLLSMRRQGPHTLVVVYDGGAEEPVLAALRSLNRLTSTWRPKKEELGWVKSWISAENHRATIQLLEKVVQVLEK
jgi:hypothetical protein